MAAIFGIGNALLDSEYAVTDTQLALSGLAKGNMTLASDSEQIALDDYLTEQKVIATKQSSGGSAANSIYAAASLGSDTFYACRVGDDANGEFYLDDLAKAGVKTSKNSIAIGGTTGTCMVLVTPDGERTMQTHLGTSAEISERDIDFTQLTDTQWLYLEGYLAMSPSVQPAIAKLKDHAKIHALNIAVSFADPAVVKFGREGLDAMLADGVTAVFCNAEEAMLYTGKDDVEKAANALLDVVQLAVVTNGAKETLITCRGDFIEHNDNDYMADKNRDLIHIETPLVANVINTNGAGDNFAGAFLHGLAQGYDLPTCGKLASEVASEVVGQFGARLQPEQYRTILQKVINPEP